MKTKTCLGPCGRTLELNEENFYRQAFGRNGFQSRCKACFSKQQNENGAKRYATDPEYRAKKIAAAVIACAKRYEDDKEGYRLYAKAHYNVKKANGPASGHLCVCGCGNQASDWAMKNDSKNIKKSKNFKWSDDINDYMAMARSCHKRYDLDAREMAA